MTLARAAGLPAFIRIEADGARRSLFALGRLHSAFARAWGGLGAMQLEAEPQVIPEGRLLNHLVTVNLGAETTSEANFEGRGWRVHRTPHHGVCVYPALVPFMAREPQARELFAVEMSPEFAAAALASRGAAAVLRPLVGARDVFAMHVLLALAEEARVGAESGAPRAESLGAALVTRLVERESEPDLPPEPVAAVAVAALSSQKLRRVLDYVSAHLDAPLALRTLAGLVEMDVFRFLRAFKQSTGLSPHRYVLEARINRAKELLRDRTLSITDVALATGFATPSHFSVTFRRLVNVTPRAYRDSLP